MEETKSIVVEFDKQYISGEKASFEPTKTVTDAALLQIKQVRSKGWDALTGLNLSGCKQLTDGSVRCLPRSLTSLDISHTCLTGEGLKFVRYRRSLTKLNASHTRINDMTVANLPKYLIELDVSHTELSKLGLGLLPSDLQKLKIDGCKYLANELIAKHKGRLGDCYRRDQMLKIPDCEGYIWSFTKPGKPTHYYGGVMHVMSEPMFDALHQRAISKCHTLLTECGYESMRLTRNRRRVRQTGYSVSPECQIATWARKKNIPLGRLDNDQLIHLVSKRLEEYGISLPEFCEGLEHLSYINRAAKLWIKGDLTDIFKAIETPSEVTMVKERNITWMKLIRKVLQASNLGSVGIFPGAAHSFGPTGVITQLRKDGWQFTREWLDPLSIQGGGGMSSPEIQASHS